VILALSSYVLFLFAILLFPVILMRVTNFKSNPFPGSHWAFEGLWLILLFSAIRAVAKGQKKRSRK
jgi:hypothetical protein